MRASTSPQCFSLRATAMTCQGDQWVLSVPSLRLPPVGIAISVSVDAISSGEAPLMSME
ncbi:MAG: hypothetical protein K5663_07035 [Clostridiales bacterium]|nr:hypothetical protein [Clostridiales bacterium]